MPTETTPEADPLSIGDTNHSTAVAPEASETPLETRSRSAADGRLFGYALVVGGLALLVVGTVAILVDQPTSITQRILQGGIAVGLVGLVVGLVGVRRRYRQDSLLVTGGVVISAITAVVFLGVGAYSIGRTAGLGTVLVLLIAVTGVPLGMTAVGLGLRKTVGTAEWLPLTAAFPLNLVGLAVILAGGIASVETVVTLGAALVLVSYLTAVPLGLRMLRRPAGAPGEPTTADIETEPQ